MKIPIAILMLAMSTAHIGAAEPLAPEKQKAIWDAEHATFEIETHFGKRFLAAYRSRDASGLATLLKKDFRGSVISPTTKARELRKSLIVESRRSARDGTTADADELSTALITPLSSLAEIETTRLRVLNIAPAEKSDGDEGQNWATTLLLTAGGKTKTGGPAAIDSRHEVVFRAATDDEFKSKAVVAAWNIISERTRVAGRELMEEVTESAQLHRLPLADNWKLPESEVPIRYSFQFAVEDFDRDGYLDIAVASVRGPTAILKSLAGKQYAVANQAFGLPMMASKAQRALACWLDFDNDGFPDLILGDRVYRNVAGKNFEELTEESGLVFPASPMGCAVADYDGDGLCDLYVLYQGETAGDEPLPWVGDDISGAPNTLWKNIGGGRFKDVSAESKAGAGMRNSFAATWLYADDDPLPDVYVANDFGTNNLLRNRGDGTFEDIAEATGSSDFATSMGVASGDLDNDGSPEIYVANMYSKMGRRIIAQVSDTDYAPGVYPQIKGACAGNRLYKRRPGGGRYTESSELRGINDIGWAYAPAIADLDNDGLLDLHATTGFLSFERGKPDG